MKVAIVLTLLKWLLLFVFSHGAHGRWTVSLCWTGGFFFQTSHPQKDSCWFRCTCAGISCSSFLDTYTVMKMKTVLETRTKEDHGVPPLQKSLLDTTPHIQSSLPYLKSLCWQSLVCFTPLITQPSPLWYAGKCLTPDEKGGAPICCICQFL